MYSLLALSLIVAASAVIARPPDPMSTAASHDEPAMPPTRKYLKEYLLPRFLWPHYFALEEYSQKGTETRRPMPATEWLTQEIDRLSRMQMSLKPESPRQPHRNHNHFKRWPHPYMRRDVLPSYRNQMWPALNLMSEETKLKEDQAIVEQKQHVPVEKSVSKEDKKMSFALTPSDEGFYEPRGIEIPPTQVQQSNLTLQGVRMDGKVNRHKGHHHPELEPEPPRHTRQNPNLSRHNLKSLVAGDVDELRAGFVSTHEEVRTRDSSRHISVHTNSTESPGSFYGVAILSAVGVVAVLAVLGFVFGWYALSKRAKAASEIHYPAYGVTGPNIDASGDRKLAHSAQMYHYQHQKQQIIAMERNGMELRSFSDTDPESEDDNEEGDYTVYECPGFATTGDIEVKNPLFNEEPTPATPSKSEIVKLLLKD